MIEYTVSPDFGLNQRAISPVNGSPVVYFSGFEGSQITSKNLPLWSWIGGVM